MGWRTVYGSHVRAGKLYEDYVAFNLEKTCFENFFCLIALLLINELNLR